MITSVTQCKGENSAEGVSTAERFSSTAHRGWIVAFRCLHAMRATTTHTVRSHQAAMRRRLQNSSHNVAACMEQADPMAAFAMVSPGHPLCS